MIKFVLLLVTTNTLFNKTSFKKSLYINIEIKNGLDKTFYNMSQRSKLLKAKYKLLWLRLMGKSPKQSYLGLNFE